MRSLIGVTYVLAVRSSVLTTGVLSPQMQVAAPPYRQKTRMDTAPPEQLEIHIQARHELDEALNRAEESLKPAATMKQVGIQVTRHDAGRFTAAVSDKAPYGTTLQNWSAKPAFHRERPDGCV